jgi:hypothetical protein
MVTCGWPTPRWRKLRPEGDDRQDTQRWHLIHEQIEQLLRGGVAPVHVLVHHQHGLTRSQPFDVRHQRMKRLLFALLRGEVQRRVAVASRNRQQLSQQGDGLAKVMDPLREQRLKLIEPLLISIVAPESRRPFELRDARVEGTVLVMGRAEISETTVWLVFQPFPDRLSDARFADAGLARYQHDAAIATLRLVPAAQEQVDLLVATDERGAGCAQRLEPALHRARTRHLVCLHPISEALRLDAAKIAILEQTAQQTAGGEIDGDRAGRRPCLQTRRQVRRLTDHTAFLGFPRADEIANHDQAGANADSYLERLNVAQLSNRLDERQSALHRALGVVFVRLRIAKIDEHAIAHVPGDEPAKPADRLCDALVIRSDHRAEIFGIELR